MHIQIRYTNSGPYAVNDYITNKRHARECEIRNQIKIRQFARFRSYFYFCLSYVTVNLKTTLVSGLSTE